MTLTGQRPAGRGRGGGPVTALCGAMTIAGAARTIAVEWVDGTRSGAEWWIDGAVNTVRNLFSATWFRADQINFPTT